MLPKVYFAAAGGRPGHGMVAKVHALFEAAGFAELVRMRDLVAVKAHFGERGCTSFVSPALIRPVVDDVIAGGGRPFMTDTGCLYYSSRANARDHAIVAAEHGFSIESLGAPVIIGDGLRGSDIREVTVGLKHFDTIDVAGAIHDADSLIVCTHVTGHMLTAFAGTLKNLGMGGAGRRMKLAVHAMVRPRIDSEACDLCETCLEHCPAEAISLDGDVMVIDTDVCIGCGECLAMCPQGATAIEWKGDPAEAQEKLGEITAGVLKNKADRAGFFSFLLNVTPSCDCWNYSAAPSVPDIGIMASKDPIAIDQAASDMLMRYLAEESQVREPGPQTKSTLLAGAGTAYARQLSYGESIGLGQRQYEMVRLED